MFKKDSPLFRYSIFLATLFLFSCFTFLSSKVELPHRGEVAKLYANQCEDDLRRIYLAAINQAKESIVLIIYSLTDEYIIDALKKKADLGIPVSVVHDAKTKQYGFKRLGNKISRYTKEGSGLMHQKILIIDKTRVYLGSANLTSSSLRVHDNLILGCYSKTLAKAILGRHPYINGDIESHRHDCTIGGQRIEFWSFPEEGHEGLEYLIQCINGAARSIKIAMFTWTHPLLTDACIEAKKRGVDVEVVMDHNQGMGVGKKCTEKLIKEHVPLFFSKSELCHHKMAIIDDSLLILGSANWTQAAFTRNDDCFVLLHKLTKEQSKKLSTLWRVIRCNRDIVQIDKKKQTFIVGFFSLILRPIG